MTEDNKRFVLNNTTDEICMFTIYLHKTLQILGLSVHNNTQYLRKHIETRVKTPLLLGSNTKLLVIYNNILAILSYANLRNLLHCFLNVF